MSFDFWAFKSIFKMLDVLDNILFELFLYLEFDFITDLEFLAWFPLLFFSLFSNLLFSFLQIFQFDFIVSKSLISLISYFICFFKNLNLILQFEFIMLFFNIYFCLQMCLSFWLLHFHFYKKILQFFILKSFNFQLAKVFVDGWTFCL